MKDTSATALFKKVDANVIRLFQRPAAFIIHALIWLGDKKRLFPNGFKKILVYILAPLIAGIVTYAGYSDQAQPAYWPDSLDKCHITYPATRSFVISIVCGFVAFIILRVFLPLLFYAPHALALRSMGLQESSVCRDGMKSAILKNLKWHDENEPIKIICISGHKLFGLEGPLNEAAQNGKLEVLFPVSDQHSPTVVARHNTYHPNFKEDTYPQVHDLVEEIKRSKAFLAKNQRNKIHEHKELCMWRVVLLSHHCIVQAYFPNRDGRHSDTAPVFVYSKETDCPHSYYDTYHQMFELLKPSHNGASTA